MVLHGEAQKHSFEPNKPKRLPKIPKEIQKIREKFIVIGAFKVPCTLP